MREDELCRPIDPEAASMRNPWSKHNCKLAKDLPEIHKALEEFLDCTGLSDFLEIRERTVPRFDRQEVYNNDVCVKRDLCQLICGPRRKLRLELTNYPRDGYEKTE